MKAKKERSNLKEEVKNGLLKEILEGDFQHAQILPSEDALCARFQVSRSTIRDALSALEKEGIIIRRQGAPTKINLRKLSFGFNLNYLEDPYQAIKGCGGIPSVELLKVEEVEAGSTPEICELLKLSPREKLLRVDRVWKSNNFPLMFLKDFIPLCLIKRFFTKEDLEFSIKNFLFEFCDEQVDHAFSEIEAVTIPEEARRALKVREGTPVLFLKETFFNEEGTPLFQGFVYLLQGVLRVNIQRRKI